MAYRVRRAPRNARHAHRRHYRAQETEGEGDGSDQLGWGQLQANMGARGCGPTLQTVQGLRPCSVPSQARHQRGRTRLSGASANQTSVEQAKVEVTSGTGIGTKHRRFGQVRVWDPGGRSHAIVVEQE